MSRRDYGALEAHIIDVFQADRIFTYNKRLHELVMAGKPRPQGGGECKTDVFVRARDVESGVLSDIKISIKKDNREFLGNKLTAGDMDRYIGPGWQNILQAATTSIRDRFENALLLYATRKYPTCENSITVGWKLEITDRPRNLSVPIPLSDRQIRDYVYKGTNLTQEKKDSYVNGVLVEGSGEADYLLTTTVQNIANANDVITQMERIDDADLGDAYFAFTANNYRTDVMKADGPRSLAVRVEWECRGGKLVPNFCYDEPLAYTGERDMAPLVIEALRTIRKTNINELRQGIDVDLVIWDR